MRAFISLLIACSLSLTGCQTPVGKWFTSHKAQFVASGALLVDQVRQIVEKDVFQNAQSAEDAILKQWNVQGFAEAGHTLEAALPTLGIAQIPDFVKGLRNIWLGPQAHYTVLATHLGELIQTEIANAEKRAGRKLLPDEANQIIESVMQGLRTSQPQALVGP